MANGRPGRPSNPTPSQVRFVVNPRLVPANKAARRLHLTYAEFQAKRASLYRAGFPRACDITGHYDLVAIDAWLDSRSSGLAPGDVAAARAEMRARIAEIV